MGFLECRESLVSERHAKSHHGDEDELDLSMANEAGWRNVSHCLLGLRRQMS